MTWLFQSPRRLFSVLGGAAAVFVVLAVLVVSVRVSGPDAPARRSPDAVVAESLPPIPAGDQALLDAAAASEPVATTTKNPERAALEAVRREHPDVTPTGRAKVAAAEGAVVVVDVLTDAGTARVSMLQDAAGFVIDNIAWR